jgi:YtfJ family uncharacterized protein
MRFPVLIPSVILLCIAVAAGAQTPAPGSPLPPLRIAERGELLLAEDDISFAPWSTDSRPGKVHVLQYFGATRADSKRFKPFTDKLEQTFSREHYHVTTIINLDAALWGTTGLVVSEVKDSKRKYPLSTMVLDEEGTGVETWQLGNEGAGLVIVDGRGIVRYFTPDAMTEETMNTSVELVRQHIEECVKVC